MSSFPGSIQPVNGTRKPITVNVGTAPTSPSSTQQQQQPAGASFKSIQVKQGPFGSNGNKPTEHNNNSSSSSNVPDGKDATTFYPRYDRRPREESLQRDDGRNAYAEVGPAVTQKERQMVTIATQTEKDGGKGKCSVQ